MKIHEALQSGKFPNASTLSRELDISTKSIHRDLEFMRDRLNLPLEYNPLKRGFHYTQEVSSFPTMQVSEGELFALIVAEKALQQYRGTTFEKPLLSAFKKMAESLPDTVSFHLADWDAAISFRTRAEPILNLEIFDALAKAAAGRKQLEIHYRKPGQAKAEGRIVDPYHFGNINGEWFLFAFDHLRKDIRTFVPARMEKVRQTGKTFPRPEKFSVESRLRDSFGVQSGHGRFDVVIRFNKRGADYVREKKWHASQKLRELKNGGVELRLKLSSLDEVARWVLSWGGDAVAVQPRGLVEVVKVAAKKILKR